MASEWTVGEGILLFILYVAIPIIYPMLLAEWYIEDNFNKGDIKKLDKVKIYINCVLIINTLIAGLATLSNSLDVEWFYILLMIDATYLVIKLESR